MQPDRTNALDIILTREPIAIDTRFAEVFYHRSLAYVQMKDKQKARQDFQKAADLYKQQGKTKDYQNALAKIKQLQ
ncbi:tetratricopeptide repeat protein [Scytonema sp. UIC 10036]|uniref:tetratricopeptide repeat protein n=1 Tax=Scytonema sp. UIC 10036 TaxID=2304196 RepID=UPI0012DAF16C|nr:tetratricopeptide repeat protein [Scytonema sp. UIC 10036]MUG97100.1 tetratricopeptide repeat protein [Scytonema sp. UIC 10036]